MESESEKPIYVIPRSRGNIARAIGLCVVAVFALLLLYLETTFGGLFSTTTVILVALFAFCLYAAYTTVKQYRTSRTVELYSDHVRVLNYDRDGQNNTDMPYSSIEVTKPAVMRGVPSFQLTIRTDPPVSWRLVSKPVQTETGQIPLYAFIREKTGELTEGQRQAEIHTAIKKLSGGRVNSIVRVLLVVGAVSLVAGIYETSVAFGKFDATEADFAAGLLVIGITLLIFGGMLYLSVMTTKRALKKAERPEPPASA